MVQRSSSLHENDHEGLKGTSSIFPLLDHNHPVITTVGCHSEARFVVEAARQLLDALLSKLRYSPYAKAVIGLSGGATPRPVYAAIGRAALAVRTRQAGDRVGDQTVKKPTYCDSDVLQEMCDEIDWERVIVFLVDERYVGSQHPDSNQHMIYGELLRHDPRQEQLIPDKNVYFPNTSLPLEACVDDYKKRLRELLVVCGRADVVTLGLGEDGHVASWFPASLTTSQLQGTCSQDAPLVAHTTTERFSVRDRITVSVALICSATLKVFYLNGANKAILWRELSEPAFLAPTSTSFGVMPSNTVLQCVLRSGAVVCVCNPPVGERTSVLEEPSFADEAHLTIVVLGASGDLAKKKTFPALFSLYCEGFLPRHFRVVGFARSKMSFEHFWQKNIEPYLRSLARFYLSQECEGDDACLLSARPFTERFKAHVAYQAGAYDKSESFIELDVAIRGYERGFASCRNRLFYLALPPSVFASCVLNIKRHCWATQGGWGRVVVEKPFGKDSESSRELSQQLVAVLDEDETFRIDHYLGKEMVQTLMALRFSNLAFQPLFHRDYVECVRVTFKEDIGVAGRGGYFDEYGIVRDIMQNHMLQILTIVAMERPCSLKDNDIRDEKVKVLKQIPPIRLRDTVLGQYGSSEDGNLPGYLDDPGVPSKSRCPTFATATLWVNSERWHGVPFIMKAGKALNTKGTEIRIRLRPVPGCIFPGAPQNELVILVQPKMAIYLKMTTKKPGLQSDLQQSELDFSMMDRFDIERLPDAYERLLLDVIRGDKQNFVRTDELEEAWRIFTPLLHELESSKVKPVGYAFGSEGPVEAYEMIARYYQRDQGYVWKSSAEKRKGEEKKVVQ